MGLLDAVRNKKKSSQTEAVEVVKTPLRLYLENLITKMDGIDGAAGVKIPGIPFDINPQKFLPLIAKQVSDEMLEKMADFMLLVANDILRIRGRRTFEICEPSAEIEAAEIEAAEAPAENRKALVIGNTVILSQPLENETIADSTEH